MRAKFVLRVRILSFFAILAALLLIVRLYFLQIVHSEDYRATALGQYVENTGAETKRGKILFTAKDGENPVAATMQATWRIAINPKLLEDADAAFAALDTIAEIDRERYDASAAKKSDPYEEVAFRLTDDEALAVRNLELLGITTVREEWRFYPGASLAAHVPGSSKTGRRERVYGLERYWEDTLRHDNGGLYVNPFTRFSLMWRR